MQFKKPRYLLTLFGAAVLGLSFGVFALGAADIVSNGGVWRALVIPAYLTMLASAVLATSLSVPNHPLLLLVGIALFLLPLSALDWLRLRRRAPDT